MNRVLILTWEYPPLIEGGLARHVRKLSEALVRRGVEVHVLTRGGDQATVEETVAGVEIHRIVEPERPTDLAEFVTWVERMNSDMLALGVELGDRFEFDLVHGHDWLVASACDHLARRYDCPLVTTIHATEYGRHQGWVNDHPQSHIHGVEKWISNRSEKVIACSDFMREQVEDIFSVEEGKVTVIPNGIDPGDLPAEDPEGLTRLRSAFATPDQNLVLLIGRLVYEKGFQLALEAMPKVIEAVPNTRFLVAGSGTHEAELHKLAEVLGLMDHGTFLGWIGDDVLHSLYRIADLTVVPSIYEPFGLVALEAMASECPVIAADTGGLREVVPVEGAGLRFRPKDPEHLAEAAIQVLSDDALRHRMVEEGLAHIRRFDWDDVADRTLKLYETLGHPADAAA
ncbi:MAG: glycosyltransferase family 4 protein [Solirubrobacterales bacterium]|nr:glycosyltransferase family 4 protein [Solirubrobacterales bacterium]